MHLRKKERELVLQGREVHQVLAGRSVGVHQLVEGGHVRAAPVMELLPLVYVLTLVGFWTQVVWLLDQISIQ